MDGTSVPPHGGHRASPHLHGDVTRLAAASGPGVPSLCAGPASEPPRPEAARSGIALWGGVECSIVRIGNVWRDQLHETGHHDRDDDLDRIAALGIRTLRYPVLWERVSPRHPDHADWAWHDTRMARLRELGIRPIVGLLHHGSGPHYTDLLDPAFPEKLSAHAARVAARYPWVRDWTPVNEPVTTARFSGLYGHWYPHRCDFGAFCRMVVNQCLGVMAAMRAIRRVIPDARLVQTEDLGHVFATSALRHQAEHENLRRWISLDLLCGHVGPAHPSWRMLVDAGVPEAPLARLRNSNAPPDVIGINHYLTSDRFLDQDMHRYPAEFAGGNGRERYADVEAVRVVPPPGPLGPEARLREAWARYRRPLAVTEAHHGAAELIECVRWLCEIWHAAERLLAEGVDICAVTIWSLFGAMDWRSLLRERAGAYEPGAFDIRDAQPRPTALADAARSLLRERRISDPDAYGPGWWRRPERAYTRLS
jgi:dTDP-4-dehydrorhamnose reductase